MTSKSIPDYQRCLADWRARVRANNAQVARLAERDDDSDFYIPIAERFRADPTRADDACLNALLALAYPQETWLDVGAGGGRFTLALARHVQRIIAVEPSEAMRTVLEEVRDQYGIENLELIGERWPLQCALQTDVALITHVGYDIEAIGPFLETFEAAAKRLCVALLLDRAPGAAFASLWEAVHGSPYAPLPALPEFVRLLEARGRRPELRKVTERAWGFDSWEVAIDDVRRRLWLRAGSTKERLLLQVISDHLVARDDGYALKGPVDNVVLVTWTPSEPL